MLRQAFKRVQSILDQIAPIEQLTVNIPGAIEHSPGMILNVPTEQAEIIQKTGAMWQHILQNPEVSYAPLFQSAKKHLTHQGFNLSGKGQNAYSLAVVNLLNQDDGAAHFSIPVLTALCRTHRSLPKDLSTDAVGLDTLNLIKRFNEQVRLIEVPRESYKPCDPRSKIYGIDLTTTPSNI